MLTPYTSKRATRQKQTLRSVANVVMCSACLAFAMTSCAKEERAKSPERIILIVVDTLRRDHVSAYPSAKAMTPNIDRIAAGGQVFTNAMSSFHATTMSMASLFTGLTPSIESGENSQSVKWNTFVACGLSRFLEHSHDKSCVPASVPTLAEDMKSAGYWTLGIVSNELLYRPSGYDRGFDTWIEVGLPNPDEKRDIFQSSPVRTAVHVNKEVESALTNRPSDRFFMYVHYLDVHDYGLFKRTYEEGVQRFDQHLGEFLDNLEAHGLLENAALILTSDHGELLAERYPNLKTASHFGNPAFQPVLEIPLIIKPATRLASDVFIRSQDLRGVVRGIAGLDDASSSEVEPNELFLSEMFYQTYRKGRWKSHWPRAEGSPLLFDLETDPHEQMNLAASQTAEHMKLLAAHRKRIDELSRKLATPPSLAPTLGDDDVERLRALGYIETIEESFGIQKLPRDQSAPTSD